MLKAYACPVCKNNSLPLDVVDFNKSCEELRAKFLPMSGNSVYYYLCHNCGFCFAPELRLWDLAKFASQIYNAEYIQVDPDYQTKRPEANAQNLLQMLHSKHTFIKHLDYGGGNGVLSNKLVKSQWNSTSYDPFISLETEIETLGKFNLITAYEVFEHVPDIDNLMQQLSLLLDTQGMILFSTLLSDGNIKANQRLNWWYASPRNGHISLFSQASLSLLAKKYQFTLASYSTGFHVMFKQIPTWATHLFKQ